MISLATCVWTLAGVIAGGSHSLALKYSSEQANEWVALVGLLRILLVGSLLIGAALLGYLVSAFAGWVIGFTVTLLIVLVPAQ